MPTKHIRPIEVMEEGVYRPLVVDLSEIKEVCLGCPYQKKIGDEHEAEVVR